MLEFYIKIRIYWSDKADTKREYTSVSGVYKSPYHKDCTLNDVFLVGKALKHFALEYDDADIMEISIEEIKEFNRDEKGAF